MEEKNKVGRPLKYETPEEMQVEIDKYFDIHNLKCINKKAVDNNYRYNVNSNKNKYLLKKLGYDINIKNILSNSQELI